MNATPGEQVGAAVDAAVDQTKSDAQAAIDRAKADADAAAAEAKRIADAALASELGQRIEAQNREFNTWRMGTDQRLAEMAEAQRQSTAQLSEATTLFGSIRALLTPPQEPKPPALEQPQGAVPTDASSTKTEPSEKQKVQAEHQPAPPPRRRHFL